jgi:hypothetical protein
LKIAAVVTCWTKASHADVIVGKFLRGFPTDEVEAAWPPNAHDISAGFREKYIGGLCKGLA